MSNLNSRKFIVCLLVLVLGCFATQAWAQSQASAGQIGGVVKDSAGAVIVGATVNVVNPGTGFNQTATTEENGFYKIVLLPPGNYKVTVTKQGFSEAVAQVSVGVGRTTDLNVALSVSGRKEEVTVTAEAIEAQRHEMAAFVGADIIANIPLNGGRFQDITTTTPTAAIDPTRGGITLAGQRMVNTGSINVDGTDYGQLFFGGIRGGERAGFAPTIPLDAIQEFQIIRAGYTAEFGRSTGGAITAVTKSGSNAFHGTAEYSIRPDSAAMSNEFYDTIQAGLVAQKCTTCNVNPNPTLHQWGASIGGPVKKDKLFFFGSYNQQRQRLPHQIFFANLASFTPTAATQEGYDAFKGGTFNGVAYPNLEQPFQQTNDAYLFLIKGDYQISNKHRLSVRYNHSNYEGQNAVSVGTSLAPTVTSALSNNGTEFDSTRTVSGTLSSFFSHFANEFRGQYARETRPRIANASQPTFNIASGVGTYGTTSFLSTTEYDYRAQFADSITWLKGKHSFKFGGEFSQLYTFQSFGFNQFGAYGFSNTSPATSLAVVSNVVSASNTCGAATCNPSGNRFDNTSAFYNRQIGNLIVHYPAKQFAGFVQDSWRALPNFTLNYGVRWEAALNPSAVADNSAATIVRSFTFPNGRHLDPSISDNMLTQFAPRLGFAWNPKGDSKTVVRGFGGIYFAPTPQLLYAGIAGAYREPPGDVSIALPITVPNALVVTGIGGSCPAPCNTVYKQLRYLAGINLNNFALNALPVLTAAQIQSVGQAIATAQGAAFNKYSGADFYTLANDYHNPRAYQAGFGLEREIAHNWTVGLEGIWIKTVYLQRDTDLNIPLQVSTDAAGRPIYGLNSGTVRPLQTLSPPFNVGRIVVRDPTAKALYRGLTLRTTMNRKWGQMNLFYTLSENLTDDDNERDASGSRAIDPFNRASDYGYSDQNRRHQFVANPVFFLPWRMDVSSAIRLLSGNPISATMGSTDVNQDKFNNDRPYWAVGVPAIRNSFTNRANAFVDLRVQKGIKFTESKELKLSAEMFNIFNFMNITYGTNQQVFCTSTAVATCGIPGGAWTQNPNFLQLRDQRPGLPTTGTLLTNNNTNGTPFEAQFSVKFIF